jgi:hypothetical protein
MLVSLKLDCQGCDVVVDLSVSYDLARQPLVIGFGHCGLEDLEVTARAGEHMLEPGR